MVISELCSADHRRRSRSLTAALRPSADVAALLRTRTRVPVTHTQWGEEMVQEKPALHYTGLLDNPLSNLTPKMREE